MISNIRTFALCGLLALPSAVWAQDQPAASGEAATPAADGNDPSLTGLAMGQAEGQSGEPQVGQTYVADNFGDWEMRCIKSAEGKDPCQLYQLLSDAEGNSVAEFSIFNLPAGQEAAAGATVVTPLETLLTAELRLKVDEGQARRDLLKLLDALPLAQRQAIVLTKLEGLSVAEASARTGASESAIKVQVHRGLKRLAALVRKDD